MFLRFGIVASRVPTSSGHFAVSIFAVGSLWDYGLRLGGHTAMDWPRSASFVLVIVAIAEAGFFAVWAAAADALASIDVLIFVLWLWDCRPRRSDRSVCRACSTAGTFTLVIYSTFAGSRSRSRSRLQRAVDRSPTAVLEACSSCTHGYAPVMPLAICIGSFWLVGVLITVAYLEGGEDPQRVR